MEIHPHGIAQRARTANTPNACAVLIVLATTVLGIWSTVHGQTVRTGPTVAKIINIGLDEVAYGRTAGATRTLIRRIGVFNNPRILPGADAKRFEFKGRDLHRTAQFHPDYESPVDGGYGPRGSPRDNVYVLRVGTDQTPDHITPVLILITVNDVREPPTNPMSLDTRNIPHYVTGHLGAPGQIYISWRLIREQYIPIVTHMEVEVRRTAGGSKQIHSVPLAHLNAGFNAFAGEPGAQYEVRIAARNAEGRGPFSESQSALGDTNDRRWNKPSAPGTPARAGSMRHAKPN